MDTSRTKDENKRACSERPNLRRAHHHRTELHIRRYLLFVFFADRPVVLTALAPQYQCSLCREFDPEFTTVAQSWRRAHPQSDNVFFAKLDFAEGRPIFMRVYPPKVMVNGSLAFNLHLMCGYILRLLAHSQLYPPIINPLSMTSPESKIPVNGKANSSGMNAEQFHKFLQSSIKLPEFPLVRPFNWQNLFITICLLTTGVIFIRFFWPQVHKFVTNKNTWAVISLVMQFYPLLTVGYDTDVYFRTYV